MPGCQPAWCYDVTPEGSPSNCCQGQPAFSADGTQSLAETHREWQHGWELSVVWIKCFSRCCSRQSLHPKSRFIIPCHVSLLTCSKYCEKYIPQPPRFGFIIYWNLTYFCISNTRCVRKHAQSMNRNSLPQGPWNYQYSHTALYWQHRKRHTSISRARAPPNKLCVWTLRMQQQTNVR